MLGLVTLYNPNQQEAAANILQYIHDEDALIIYKYDNFLNEWLKERFKHHTINPAAHTLDIEEYPRVKNPKEEIWKKKRNAEK